VSVDDGDRSEARARYRFYRERGYRISDHDLAGQGDDAR
jgi:DNA polymerase IIIc chi subunit